MYGCAVVHENSYFRFTVPKTFHISYTEGEGIQGYIMGMKEKFVITSNLSRYKICGTGNLYHRNNLLQFTDSVVSKIQICQNICNAICI